MRHELLDIAYVPDNKYLLLAQHSLLHGGEALREAAHIRPKVDIDHSRGGLPVVGCQRPKGLAALGVQLLDGSQVSLNFLRMCRNASALPDHGLCCSVLTAMDLCSSHNLRLQHHLHLAQQIAQPGMPPDLQCRRHDVMVIVRKQLQLHAAIPLDQQGDIDCSWQLAQLLADNCDRAGNALQTVLHLL